MSSRFWIMPWRRVSRSPLSRAAVRNQHLIADSLACKGYLGGKSAKGAPKRQKTPFGPSMESLGPRSVNPAYAGGRHPCLVTLLRTYLRRSHPLLGETGETPRAVKIDAFSGSRRPDASDRPAQVRGVSTVSPWDAIQN